MVFEIRPAQVAANLESVNQSLTSMSSSAIAPVSPPISDFVGSTELCSASYDALKRHMDVEINAGLLNQCRQAISTLSQANARHIQALGVISQYGVINTDQIEADINTVNRMLSSVQGFTFPGVEDLREAWRRELQFLQQKRIDFWTYMAGSHGLYDNLFAELRDQIFRMGYASFCSTSGVVTIPSIGKIYLSRLVTLDEKGNPVEFHWDEIEELLARPYTEISEREFMALAGVYAHLIHMGEYGIEGLERFLNAMAQPFTGDIPELGGPLPTKDQLEGFAEPFLSLDLWHVCQYLVDGIKGALEVQIGMWTTIEFAYTQLYNFTHEFVEDIRSKRHQLMQGFGLLSTLGTNSPLGGISNVNVDGTSGNVFLGGPEGAGFSLSLTNNIFQLQFTPLPSINSPPESFLLGDSLPGLYLNWNDPHRLILVDMPGQQVVRIPQVKPGVTINPDGTMTSYAANHIAQSAHAQESSLHNPTNYGLQTLNNLAGFTLAALGEFPIPGLSTIIGSQYLFNQMMTAENRMLQAMGEYVCAVQASLDAMLQMSLETNYISLHQLDALEIHDGNDNPIKQITMPSPGTINNMEFYR